MNEPFRMGRGRRPRTSRFLPGGRWRDRYWPARPRYLVAPTYVTVEASEDEKKCIEIALKQSDKFNEVLYKDAHKEAIVLCKDIKIQKIIKEKILDKEPYLVIVPTYGPSYGESFKRPKNIPDSMIGVL